MRFFSSVVLLTAQVIATAILSINASLHPQINIVPPLYPPQQIHAPAASSSVSMRPATSTTPTKTSLLQKLISHIPLIASTTSAPPPVATPAAPPVTYLAPEVVNTNLRESLVNIICTTKAGGSFRPISGSGVIVSSKGVILTNAHVAQFFLLRDYLEPDNVDCIIRTGSPASPMYNAELLYLPPAWIDANASQIGNGEATGSGENDYAFLLITSRTDGSPLPTSFPNPLLTLDEPILSDPVVIASYPAQFLGGVSIQDNLYASSAVSTVQKLYTFTHQGPVDSISVGSPINAQSGSSGGSVARLEDGAIEAIVATATAGTSTSDRELRAITLAHIDRSLAKYGKGGIASFLTQGDLTDKAKDFNTNVAPTLTEELEDALK